MGLVVENPAAPSDGVAPSHEERPVFTTANGRPRRRPRWLGRSIMLAGSGWVAAVIVGGSGFSAMPALPYSAAQVAHRGPSSHTHFVSYGARRARARRYRREEVRERLARARDQRSDRRSS